MARRGHDHDQRRGYEKHACRRCSHRYPPCRSDGPGGASNGMPCRGCRIERRFPRTNEEAGNYVSITTIKSFIHIYANAGKGKRRRARLRRLSSQVRSAHHPWRILHPSTEALPATSCTGLAVLRESSPSFVLPRNAKPMTLSRILSSVGNDEGVDQHGRHRQRLDREQLRVPVKEPFAPPH